MNRLKLATALLVIGGVADAQAPTGISWVDSAAVARAAYRRAAVATEPMAALREIERSALAWPTQPAYAWARALLAARSSDAATTIAALDDYAALSLGRDLTRVRDFAFIADTRRFRRLVTIHDSLRAPIVASRVVLAVSDSTFWPEAADYDSRTKSWYLGSVRRGTILRVDADGRERALWPADSGRFGAVLGVRVDARRRLLWATTSVLPHQESSARASSQAALLQIGLDDGKIQRRWDFPSVDGGHVLGDLAVAANGDVFVTDSRQPVLYRKRTGSDSLEAKRHPLFNSLQGVAPTDDGSVVYVADYSHGILRVDLASNDVTRLPDAPRSTSLGCDGLVLYRGALIAIQNGVSPAQVVRFELDRSGRAIVRAEVIDRNVSIADEPTIGTIVDDEFVYVANSQWEKFDSAGQVRPGARLRGPILLGVRLR